MKEMSSNNGKLFVIALVGTVVAVAIRPVLRSFGLPV
jgi:uncharacterized membrane protein YvlD (DUF360 family)